MTLKQQILQLKQQGLKQSDIAKQLKCSTGTVSYHCNPEVKSKIINKKRQKRKLQKSSSISPYLSKEINIDIKSVNWKYAEILCQARLTELNYEIFIPSITGGEIDFIAYKNSNYYRIQVKAISPIKKNYISIKLHRKSGSYNNPKSINYTNIDWFLIYDGTNIYKVNKSYINNNKNLTLRYKIPANNQIDNITMAYDFIL